MVRNQLTRVYSLLLTIIFIAFVNGGCASPIVTTEPGERSVAANPHTGSDLDVLPLLTAVELSDGARLQVMATTNIVADVVAQVGGDRIDLVPVIPIGTDPHSFTPTPQDLIVLSQAQVIFINGLQLEESLMAVLESLDNATPIVAVNAGVETAGFGKSSGEHAHPTHEDEAHEDADHAADHADEETDVAHQDEVAEASEEDHDHAGADPHTWFNVHAVEQWVDTIEQVLSTLDPANAATYAANADAYRAELATLESELEAMVAELPLEQRKLVTDHDAFGYFAAAYDFTVIGAVIPSLSTVASSSASEFAALQDQIEAEGVPAIFVGTTVNSNLATQLAADTGITVATIYTGALSDADGPAPTYLDLMRYNMRTIVDALKD